MGVGSESDSTLAAPGVTGDKSHCEVCGDLLCTGLKPTAGLEGTWLLWSVQSWLWVTESKLESPCCVQAEQGRGHCCCPQVVQSDTPAGLPLAFVFYSKPESRMVVFAQRACHTGLASFHLLPPKEPRPGLCACSVLEEEQS